MRNNNRDYLHLLCDVSELAAILTGSDNIENFLKHTVDMVARHLAADVCSIYLYNETVRELVLEATVGLNPDAVGKVRMKLGEGLVGMTLDQLKPVLEASGSRNPKFKYFEEAGEDRFESFLAVPIQRGVERIGVLVVQHELIDYFDDIDVMALRAIASQLAGAIENARLLIELDRRLSRPQEPDVLESLRFVKGKSAVAGYAYGPSTVLGRTTGNLLAGDSGSDPGGTIEDFHDAVEKTIDQLQRLQDRVSERLPESAALIFTAHFMILKDEGFLNRIISRISEGLSPCEAVRSAARHYISIFSSSSNTYMREKVLDIEDLANRILVNLKCIGTEDQLDLKRCIVIAPELYPSDILKLASDDVKGIILVSGGVTSHISILARSMQIPVVIADRKELLRLPEETPVLIDADIGNIYVSPSEKIVRKFEVRNEAKQAVASMVPTMSETTKTKDGGRINLLANINILSELKLAVDLKAEGVGLYRTEFPFLIRSSFPSEEEQYLIYRQVFEEMAGKVVTIRTLDIAGDKVLPYVNAPREANPQLGLRSIRFTLNNRDIFEQQVRAILRAAAAKEHVRIMFPMISSLDEFRLAKQVVHDCINLLARFDIKHKKNPAIGVLIELPSLVEIIDDIAREADFLSIGTNDFVQYMLAVDRTNENVSDYYEPYHPSVLRGIARIVKAALAHDKDVYVCGEMAHELNYIPFLIGVGVRSLSLDPQFMPSVQRFIENLTESDAVSYAGELLSQTTIKGIRRIVQKRRGIYQKTMETM